MYFDDREVVGFSPNYKDISIKHFVCLMLNFTHCRCFF